MSLPSATIDPISRPTTNITQQDFVGFIAGQSPSSSKTGARTAAVNTPASGERGQQKKRRQQGPERRCASHRPILREMYIWEAARQNSGEYRVKPVSPPATPLSSAR